MASGDGPDPALRAVPVVRGRHLEVTTLPWGEGQPEIGGCFLTRICSPLHVLPHRAAPPATREWVFSPTSPPDAAGSRRHDVSRGSASGAGGGIMSGMTVKRSTRRVAATRIVTVARRLLDASTLCAISTVSRHGRAHVNTVYFAWSSTFQLVWLSAPEATHSKNLRSNPSAAVAVYDSTQTWGGPDRGIQLVGTARELSSRTATAAEELYAQRFPAYTDTDPAGYRFYRFNPRRLKVFDEQALGGGVFVTALVRRGGDLEWAGTDLYRGS